MAKKAEKISEILEDAEAKAVILALGRGQSVFSTDDALKAVQWAEGIRINQTLLELVLDGTLSLTIKDGAIAMVK